VHVSAIGADRPTTIPYLRSKAEGEAGIQEAVPETVIMRPSIVFGPEDGFFNRFASMSRFAPALPLIGGGQTRFQPVYAGDVAEAIARAVDGEAQPGGVYELGGPEVLTFRECLERMLQITGRSRALLPIPFGIAQSMGSVLQYLPGKMLTPDQVRMLRFDTVVSERARAEGRTLEGLGIAPTALDLVLPTYLARFRPQGEFIPNPARSVDPTLSISRPPTLRIRPAVPTKTRMMAKGREPVPGYEVQHVRTTTKAVTKARRSRPRSGAPSIGRKTSRFLNRS
jgi:NADH dehydrogenase